MDAKLNKVLLKETTHDGGILRLTLANPPANALSLEMLAALQAALDRADGDGQIRVIILAAEGKLFCAGHDLKEITDHRKDQDKGRAYFVDLMARCAQLMQTIVNHPKPVIAQIDGLATAAGCQLVASCDLAIASEAATFCTPGVDIGLFCSTPMVALSRTMHRKHVMEMLLTGEAINAAAARETGLVNRVVPGEYLDQTTLKYATAIASKSSRVVKIGKQAFYQQLEMGLKDAYRLTGEVMLENLLAGESEEGIGAFLEHRDAKWDD